MRTALVPKISKAQAIADARATSQRKTVSVANVEQNSVGQTLTTSIFVEPAQLSVVGMKPMKRLWIIRGNIKTKMNLATKVRYMVRPKGFPCATYSIDIIREGDLVKINRKWREWKCYCINNIVWTDLEPGQVGMILESPTKAWFDPKRDLHCLVLVGEQSYIVDYRKLERINK